MVSLQDVHTASFKKSIFGYNVTDVDHLLEQVEERILSDEQSLNDLQDKVDKLKKLNLEKESQLSELIESNEKMQKELDQLKAELIKSNQRVIERPQPVEDDVDIRGMLMTVQRMSDQIIEEAKDSANTIVSSAQSQALQTQIEAQNMMSRAETESVKMIGDAEKKRDEINTEYARLCSSVHEFRQSLLAMYKKEMSQLMEVTEFKPLNEVADAEYVDFSKRTVVKPVVPQVKPEQTGNINKFVFDHLA